METNFESNQLVEIRDAECRVKQICMASGSGRLSACQGLSEWVSKHVTTTLTKLGTTVGIFEPAISGLFNNHSSCDYCASSSNMEMHYSQSPAANDQAFVARTPVLDFHPFLLDPAFETLKQPGQWIQFAKSAGLGDTIQVGNLTNERNSSKHIVAEREKFLK